MYNYNNQELAARVNNLAFACVFTVSISSAVPIWGQELEISCNMFPRPYNPKVQWTLNGKPQAKGTRSVWNDNPMLSVVREKASMSLEGKWTCTVDYKGKVGRASATVTVNGEIQKKQVS